MSGPGYPVVVYPLGEEDGGGFAALAPDLPGCKGDGETPEAALSDLYSAIGEWIDECDALGRKVPAPGSYVSKKRDEHEHIIAVIRMQADALKKQEDFIKGRLAETQNGLAALEASVADLLERHSASEENDFPGVVTGGAMVEVMWNRRPATAH